MDEMGGDRGGGGFLAGPPWPAAASGSPLFAGFLNSLSPWASSLSGEPSCVHGTHLPAPPPLHVAVSRDLLLTTLSLSRSPLNAFSRPDKTPEASSHVF